jgi:hypothetical protein
MKEYLVSKDFDVREFVSPQTWNKWGWKSAWFNDPFVYHVAQLLKDHSGGETVTINNWLWGGVRKYSGYRPPGSGVGSNESDHGRGWAEDVQISNFTPREVLEKLILPNLEEYKNAGLTTIEDLSITKTWNHLSCRPWPDFDWVKRDSYFDEEIGLYVIKP